jgi:hypothetical protein
MNIFSEDHFLEAFGKAYFPNQTLTSELFELEGRIWKLPFCNSKPISGATFIDFFEPLDDKVVDSRSKPRPVRYLSWASHGMVSCSEWVEQTLDRWFEPSPTILWSHFESWDAFTHYVKQKQSKLFLDDQRRRRKLEKEVGTVQYVLDDRRPEVLETCFRWKSEQSRRTGVTDQFTNPSHLDFLRELANRRVLQVSSLSAGGQLLAVDSSLLNKGRFYSWIGAYNSAYSQYAPGRLLFHFLLEESFKQKHTEFDLLWGGEDYKWNYATHVRLIAELGVRPFPQQLKHLLKSTLRSFPGVTKSLRQLRNQVLSTR